MHFLIESEVAVLFEGPNIARLFGQDVPHFLLVLFASAAVNCVRVPYLSLALEQELVPVRHGGLAVDDVHHPRVVHPDLSGDDCVGLFHFDSF